ncbi:WSC-domain-containing protein [Mollisia scopiformis]|uniref:WSC-domain-containing protein n=1 Tax=Mollisia scopiformis TaxID=149040 RepID=A0A194WUN0_MOLSC|nr:WSC-domain-containing protein [Mollisia scopiformis]KUJ11317.1 WSC-domain-containing protein [Mollisia scopiformis]
MVATSAPSGYVYVGCYADNQAIRLLDGAIYTSSSMTVSVCAGYCSTISGARFYPLIGVEDAGQCFCGSSFPRSPGIANEAGCNEECSGDSTQTCGGQGYINVYNATSLPSWITLLPSSTSTSTNTAQVTLLTTITQTPTSSPSNSTSPSPGTSAAVVAPAVIAGLLALSLLAIAGLWFLRRRKWKSISQTSPSHVEDHSLENQNKSRPEYVAEMDQNRVTPHLSELGPGVHEYR